MKFSKIVFFFFVILVGSCVFQKSSKNIEDENSENMFFEKIGDTLINVKSYYHNKTILKDDFNIDTTGQLHGSYREYSNTSVLLIDWQYWHGERNGKQYMYDHTGQILMEENFVLGKKHGKQYSLNRGDTLSVKYYNMGELLKKEIPDDYYDIPSN